MREIRGRVLLFSVFLLCGLIIGCATPLADPTGPNSSLIVGKVIINNRHLPLEKGGDALPLGTIQDEIRVEIESKDESQFITASTESGYFLIPNIPPNTYYIGGVSFRGTDMFSDSEMRISFPKEVFFAPVPGAIVYLGTFSLEISENNRITLNHSPPNPEEAKSHLLTRYSGTPWLARQFRNPQWQR